ncbi:MAG: hypothetical protein AAF234_13535 [Pseudomonadota bacterium]
MEAALTGFLGSSFKRGADAEAYRRAVQNFKAERDRKARKDEARNDSAEIADLGGMAITAVQAETFRVELETYQTATIEALELNREALDQARQRLAETLAQAFILEDGRRVFKTEDGQRVIDEFGEDVSPEIIAPEHIPDHHPTAETFFEQLGHVRALEQEQTDLLEFQSELDDLDALLDGGDMTVRELDEAREHLRQNAPEAVRADNQAITASQASPNRDVTPATEVRPLAFELGR